MATSSGKTTVSTGTWAIVLTIIFVVLKLTHVIGWDWVWVLAPLWIVAGLGLLGLLIAAIVIVLQLAKVGR